MTALIAAAMRPAPARLPAAFRRRGGSGCVLGLAMLTLAACAGSNAVPERPVLEPPTLGDLVDPVTGSIDPAYALTRISLAGLVEDELARPLDANDRRLLDAAFDRALAGVPAAAPAVWRNPANGHRGEVTLLQWLLDPRQGSLCGIVGHASRLGSPPRLEGKLTICRDGLRGDWRIDTVAFVPRPPAPATAAAARRVPMASAPARRPPAIRPPVATVANRQPAAAPVTARPAATGTTVHERVSTPTDPNRVITRTGDRIVPPPAAGRRGMGELLQDQAPHTPVR